ncbi:hypothetical protein CROQUDRAFT_663254 [Cronartium quercuum f. sp. fusiforme G11]|uniref:Polyadenylation factor subunit 2 n=1 Tax=Cronartium quercuum f. sp. fusiforme G11 TaxID=708437 RepID=A0A9P6T7C8_9BASI|nr:hypothetical protein CROQUDRAFT_663254 [Cronartium quercuum f. sp. fusiforme G11]
MATSPASPAPSASPAPEREPDTKAKAVIQDLRPKHGRIQGWDAWRPGPYGPPSPPSMERRIAEESALEMAAVSGHGRQDGRARKIRPRRTVDVGGSMARWALMRSLRTCADEHRFIRPCIDHLVEFLPPQANLRNPSTSILTKYVHTSTNKVRCPINVVRFTPDARRVLTGATSGEFTLWNALTFNFETILQAHDSAVRALDWAKSGAWLVSGDNAGVIKYFQPNMNNLQVFEGHKDSVRDISFAPNDARFVSCGDDGLIKLWGFEERREERSLTGHGWDVKCVKWHPTKGLLCSGGKDSLVKFWDPRSSKCLATLHGHKSSVQACAWNPNGHSVATGSRDQSVKVFDIRMMKELVSLRGHKKEVCSLTWHPIHHEILTSAGSDGTIIYWTVPEPTPTDELEFAHDSAVWGLDYHPLGHTLVSGSNDHTTRFWSRGRPGIKIANDKFHIGKDRARELGIKDEEEQPEDFFVPGLGHQYHHSNGPGMPMDFDSSSGPSAAGPSSAQRFQASQQPPLRTEPAAIPGFGRAVDASDTGLPGLASTTTSAVPGGWRRGPLLSQEAAMGRDLGAVAAADRKMRWKTTPGNRGGMGRSGVNRWPGGMGQAQPSAPAPNPSNGGELDEFGRELPPHLKTEDRNW